MAKDWKKDPPPRPPRHCRHDEGTYPVAFDVVQVSGPSKTGYHNRCNGCHIILSTDMPQ